MIGSLSPRDAYEKIKEGIFSIIDVRTAQEFDQSHIDGAINIDIYHPDFVDVVSALPKEKKYLVNCQAGGRSANATTVMKSLGLDATNLEGGINAWVGEGLPTVK